VRVLQGEAPLAVPAQLQPREAELPVRAQGLAQPRPEVLRPEVLLERAQVLEPAPARAPLPG
jgi:hypothetical protein